MDKKTQIDFELNKLLDRQLETGEKILWNDQPVPRFFTVFTACMLFIGLIYYGFAIPFMADVLGFKMPASITWNEVIEAFFLLPFFFLFGLYFVLAPFFEHRRTLQTVYAITDRRVICIRNRRKPLTHIYPFKTISQIRIDEKKSGVGDVIIVCGVRVVGETSFDKKHGFFHVRNARKVGRCLEKKVSTAIESEGTKFENEKDTRITDETPKPPILVEDKVKKDWVKSLAALPLALIWLGGMAAVVFGAPVVLSWATNTGRQGFVFFLVLCFLLLQLRTVYFAKKSAGWPTVRGIIEECYIQSDQEGGYKPRITYTYQVAGKEYWNNEITYKQRSNTLNEKPSKGVIARYSEGMPVTVYYHPRKPGLSVLEPGRGWGNGFVLAILLSFCLGTGIWTAVVWEGFDSARFVKAWETARQTAGLEAKNTGESNPQVKVILPAAPDPEFKNRKFTVPSQHLWVKAAPSHQSAVIWDLKKGDIVTPFTQVDKWILVRMPTGQGGWVLRGYITEIEIPSATVTRQSDPNKGSQKMPGVKLK